MHGEIHDRRRGEGETGDVGINEGDKRERLEEGREKVKKEERELE